MRATTPLARPVRRTAGVEPISPRPTQSGCWESDFAALSPRSPPPAASPPPGRRLRPFGAGATPPSVARAAMTTPPRRPSSRDDDSYGFATPPQTPRGVGEEGSPQTRRRQPFSMTTPPQRVIRTRQTTPPPSPLFNRGGKKACTMEGALIANSLDSLREVLDDDPLAALKPLAHNLDPPVFAAIRNCCSLEIVEMLVQNGADCSATDREKRSSLDLICAAPGFPAQFPGFDMQRSAASLGPFFGSEDVRCRYAAVLLRFGADAARVGPRSGKAPAEVAEACGYGKLAHLLRHWNGQQAELLRRLSKRGAKSISEGEYKLEHLPATVLDRISDALAPRFLDDDWGGVAAGGGSPREALAVEAAAAAAGMAKAFSMPMCFFPADPLMMLRPVQSPPQPAFRDCFC